MTILVNETSNHACSHYTDYLQIDRYLTTFMDHQALDSALETGLIDLLSSHQQIDQGQACDCLRSDRLGTETLLALLTANQVIEQQNDQIQLTAQFRKAMRFRDLLEAKIAFSKLVAPDVMNGFTALLQNPQKFMEQSKLFELFGYHRCFEVTDENIELTRRWMRFTSTYTRYEAAACLAHHDFSQYRQLMDIGGNSGEFSRQLCRQHARLLATVIDLPVVCEVGMQHVADTPEANRIRFFKANALADQLPDNMDIVTFKSILHDWPADATQRFLEQAYTSLKPGGTVLIFERSPIQIKNQRLPYSMLPMFLFFRSFRTSDDYVAQLQNNGFTDITIQHIELETPFYLISATKQ
ncbi:MAG: hypothetical protein B0D91_03695 [Oceanospirillales bacterium LUC14_002_19_P2]|nr:MAG: hypothetical protein B0D91_03695 [Oceanospirillales bacterium LUC14_002_19_P2]